MYTLWLDEFYDDKVFSNTSFMKVLGLDVSLGNTNRKLYIKRIPIFLYPKYIFDVTQMTTVPASLPVLYVFSAPERKICFVYVCIQWKGKWLSDHSQSSAKLQAKDPAIIFPSCHRLEVKFQVGKLPYAGNNKSIPLNP
jgi:hypothetical protein